TLTWSSNGTSCTNSAGEGTGGFATGGIPNGSDQVGPLNAPPNQYNYSVTCTGPGGNASDGHSINISVPTAFITANPDRVATGGDTDVSFSAAQITTSCTVTSSTSGTIWGPTAPTPPLPGFIATTTLQNVSITQGEVTFTITCDGGSVTDTVIVHGDIDVEEF
ncbi:hypothetical protein L0Y34_00560, partial [Candidatus Parcubacteria bacterium]|nr:hypothetical protein [Candidatus Parcubacteria bacterium]